MTIKFGIIIVFSIIVELFYLDYYLHKNFRNHMYKLHGFYIDELMFKSKSITRSFVISYVNDLHQAQQMFVLNYNLRKHNIETSNNEKYNIVSENSSNSA